ncbi:MULTISPECIES: succinate dehydrogenase, hydrophobic membrane anchor protein [unclassified Sphingomonas]|uniref:succinate dehydrogenase, hydrophobic membrane anchor protein n=1 Tax=unclassified Sphingomonas TaxID=196159 RepID=UPI0006FB51EE|nr:MULTISPECIES: succinate dehydrogenase, hydrophobic membrane anchor protein [unclassified Sphingomonas]KQX26151.1 succinate dehydrogenase [Sphingomonas sp. Root1294]KQY69218.1 succinate dehydrogenase [Sphingomonas sp. Root50]KRB89474.1 succinate dehydrogenase [Sphingomonas sp. Root720]
MGNGTGIGRVRGLGSARHGAMHWWRQRVTAAGNLLLVTWFVVSLFRLPNLGHDVVLQWIGSPIVAVPLILLTISVFYHLRLGLQVVFEDYVHEEAGKVFCLLLLNLYAIAGAALAIFSILKIAFGGVSA